MSTVLIVPLDPATGERIERLVRLAGYRSVVRPACDIPADDDPTRHVDAEVLLVDADAPVPATAVPTARRRGTLVYYFSTRLSPYDLVMHARACGAAHFPFTGGPALFRRLVEDALRPLSSPEGALLQRNRELGATVIPTSIDQVAIASQLRDRSREAIALAAELTTMRQLSLAACRASRDALRRSVIACARNMKETGVPRDSAVALVRAMIERSQGSPDQLAPAAHPAHLPYPAHTARDAAEWCDDVYRAA